MLHHQHLFFGGKELEDKRALADYGVQSESTLVLKQIKGTSMQIFVQTNDGKTIQLTVESTDIVMRVKAKVQVKQGISLGQQNLFFNEQRLEDSKTLSHYNVEDGSTLVLRLGESMQIFVKTESGRSIDLKVDPSDTIACIKAQV